jgi:short-subunit dehydrogenase
MNAFVTGATSGIGRAIAWALAERHAALWLVGRNAAALEDVAMDARRRGAPAARSYTADLARPQDVQGLAERLVAEIGSLDVFVYSAGAYAFGPIASTPAEAMDTMYQVNVRAPYVLSQVLLVPLREAAGNVVFVNSLAAQSAAADVAAYAATKSALRALADSLRAEVNDAGIRVLSVYPGRTASRMQEAVCAAQGRTYRPDRLPQPEDIAALVMAALAAPRTAEVTDLCVRPMAKG